MHRIVIAGLLLLALRGECAADDAQLIRPITTAGEVIAVYGENWGFGNKGPGFILAVWPDGHAVWSADSVNGGPPYCEGRVDPKNVSHLVTRFERDGLFDDDALNRAQFGPDSQFLTILFKSGEKTLKMQSWHELAEQSERVVGTSSGLLFLEGQNRLEVLRKEPAEYLFYRMVWSETRTKLADLLPRTGIPSKGKPTQKAGILSWVEPAAAEESRHHGVGGQPRGKSP